MEKSLSGKVDLQRTSLFWRYCKALHEQAFNYIFVNTWVAALPETRTSKTHARQARLVEQSLKGRGREASKLAGAGPLRAVGL